MCRRPLHFTDLDMYSVNHALEDVLQTVRGRCLSEADATTSGIQVAVKSPAIQSDVISCCQLPFAKMKLFLQAFQEQQQNFNTGQAGAVYPGVWQFLVGMFDSVSCVQCLHTCSVAAQSQLHDPTVLYNFQVVALNKLNHTVNNFDCTCMQQHMQVSSNTAQVWCTS